MLLLLLSFQKYPYPSVLPDFDVFSELSIICPTEQIQLLPWLVCKALKTKDCLHEHATWMIHTKTAPEVFSLVIRNSYVSPAKSDFIIVFLTFVMLVLPFYKFYHEPGKCTPFTLQDRCQHLPEASSFFLSLSFLPFAGVLKHYNLPKVISIVILSCYGMRETDVEWFFSATSGVSNTTISGTQILTTRPHTVQVQWRNQGWHWLGKKNELSYFAL